MKAVIDGGDSPDLILFPQDYVGRDVVSRLSVQLDRPVLTNNVDIAVDGDAVKATTPVFGGTKLVTTTFTGAGPYLVAVRPKSFAAEPAGGAAPEVVAAPVPDLGAAGAAKVVATHVEEHHGPKLDEADIVVSGGRGLGEAAKYELIEQLAKVLKGAPGRVAGDRRCRLGALQLPGRPDRQGRQADRVHRRRDLRGDPAHGRHEGRQEHHRHQQGQGSADLRCRRPRHRRRRAQGAPQADRGAARTAELDALRLATPDVAGTDAQARRPSRYGFAAAGSGVRSRRRERCRRRRRERRAGRRRVARRAGLGRRSGDRRAVATAGTRLRTLP